MFNPAGVEQVTLTRSEEGPVMAGKAFTCAATADSTTSLTWTPLDPPNVDSSSTSDNGKKTDTLVIAEGYLTENVTYTMIAENAEQNQHTKPLDIHVIGRTITLLKI